ncbi:MAG: DUF309 domain-containing protein [Thermoflexales bacterium]|nr:DUF309 domain-containing protein [Thermoflexales bacterium]
MQRTIVALIDDLAFQQRLEAAAQALGMRVVYADSERPAVDFLVQHQPALVVVDLQGQRVDWRAWVLAAKTSPATRRVPILAFGPHVDIATWEEARRLGCDALISNGVFMRDPVAAIQQHARPDQSAELAEECQKPLPALAREAIAQFNRGEYWEQHETFEHVWRDTHSPVRQLYQGILQVGVAYYQVRRRNYIGARKMFQRAWQYLSVLPDVCQGVDVAQLRADAQAAFAELERLGPERIGEFDPALLKPVRLINNEDNEHDDN